MNWRAELRTLPERIPKGELPDLVAELARADALARERLYHAEASAQPQEDELLTAAEVAKRLKTSAKWIYPRARELGAIRLGRHVRFRSSAVDAYIRRREAASQRRRK